MRYSEEEIREVQKYRGRVTGPVALVVAEVASRLPKFNESPMLQTAVQPQKSADFGNPIEQVNPPEEPLAFSEKMTRVATVWEDSVSSVFYKAKERVLQEKGGLLFERSGMLAYFGDIEKILEKFSEGKVETISKEEQFFIDEIVFPQFDVLFQHRGDLESEREQNICNHYIGKRNRFVDMSKSEFVQHLNDEQGRRFKIYKSGISLFNPIIESDSTIKEMVCTSGDMEPSIREAESRQIATVNELLPGFSMQISCLISDLGNFGAWYRGADGTYAIRDSLLPLGTHISYYGGTQHEMVGHGNPVDTINNLYNSSYSLKYMSFYDRMKWWDPRLFATAWEKRCRVISDLIGQAKEDEEMKMSEEVVEFFSPEVQIQYKVNKTLPDKILPEHLGQLIRDEYYDYVDINNISGAENQRIKMLEMMNIVADSIDNSALMAQRLLNVDGALYFDGYLRNKILKNVTGQIEHYVEDTHLIYANSKGNANRNVQASEDLSHWGVPFEFFGQTIQNDPVLRAAYDLYKSTIELTRPYGGQEVANEEALRIETAIGKAGADLVNEWYAEFPDTQRLEFFDSRPDSEQDSYRDHVVSMVVQILKEKRVPWDKADNRGYPDSKPSEITDQSQVMERVLLHQILSTVATTKNEVYLKSLVPILESIYFGGYKNHAILSKRIKYEKIFMMFELLGEIDKAVLKLPDQYRSGYEDAKKMLLNIRAYNSASSRKVIDAGKTGAGLSAYADFAIKNVFPWILSYDPETKVVDENTLSELLNIGQKNEYPNVIAGLSQLTEQSPDKIVQFMKDTDSEIELVSADLYRAEFAASEYRNNLRDKNPFKAVDISKQAHDHLISAVDHLLFSLKRSNNQDYQNQIEYLEDMGRVIQKKNLHEFSVGNTQANFDFDFFDRALKRVRFVASGLTHYKPFSSELVNYNYDNQLYPGDIMPYGTSFK